MIGRLLDRWERRGPEVRARRAEMERARERDRELVRIAGEASVVEMLYGKAHADRLMARRLRERTM